MKSFSFSLLLATATAAWLGEVKQENGVTYQCKCYPDNPCWPSQAEWGTLNTTVGGALFNAIPPGAVCHNKFENVSTYDEAKCANVNANWLNEQWLTDQPIDALWPLYTNNTCLPTTEPNSTCTRGFYGRYVINATTKAHIKAGVDFARTHNLRLIIRNTGHDFLGRSTGWEALYINTHSFRDVTFIKNYTGPGNWTGGAAVIGAGVQGRALFRLAYAQTPKVAIVGGECPTVGWGGGYIQGGGHGPLTSILGMGADSVLSFDVVTVDGEYVTASAVENPDLFWALKGGGPSTFAVVVSITAKTYPEFPTAATIININSTLTNDTALLNKGFHIFHNLANLYVDNGMFVYFELQVGSLHIQPFVGPYMNATKIKQVLKPLFDQLDAAKVPYDTVTKDFSTWFDMYIDIFEDEQPNRNSVVGGRIFVREDIASNGDAIADALLLASQPTNDTLGFTVGHIVGPGHGVPYADNAINPVWRNASSFVITNVLMNGDESWEVKEQRASVQTNVVGAALRKAGPNGATYVNEGDLHEPNWQESYWGRSKYDRLVQIRDKWDPNRVLYAQRTPGTEDWVVIDYGTKLCKSSQPVTQAFP